MIRPFRQRSLNSRGCTDSDLTGYGLVNAVTHYSQEVDDYDRATEFEVLGGRLLDQTSAEWRFLAEAG